MHFRPWMVTSTACQHPAFMLWFKQPPELRGPSPEVWKTLAEDEELHSMFAGPVDGGAPGNVGVRVWGIKPANPKVAAHVANLLGAPVPAQITSVRVLPCRAWPSDGRVYAAAALRPGGIWAGGAHPRPPLHLVGPQHPRPASLCPGI